MAENQIKLLQALETKVNLLIEMCDNLKLQNQDLTTQISDLQQQLETKQQSIEAVNKELETAISKYENLKLVRRLPSESPEERKKMKLHINGLVREIDKCITLINGTMQ